MKIIAHGIWGVASAGETTCFQAISEDLNILLDSGMNPSRSVQQSGGRLVDISHVFLSHCHSDHTTGFASFVFGRSIEERRFGKAQTLTVLGDEHTINAAKTILGAMYPDRDFDVIWKIVDQGETLNVGPVSMEFLRTDHTVPGLGIKLKSGGSTDLVFTSDTALSDELIRFCESAKLAIVECFGTENDFGPIMSKQKHLSSNDTRTLVETANIQKAILFQMHIPYQAVEKRAELMSAFGSLAPDRVIFPTLGQVIE